MNPAYLINLHKYVVPGVYEPGAVIKAGTVVCTVCGQPSNVLGPCVKGK